MFHLPFLDYHKGLHSETVGWKRYIGQGIGKGHRASTPSLGVSPSLHPSALNNPEPHHLGVLWRFHYIGTTDCIIGHQCVSSPLPNLCGAESSKLLIKMYPPPSGSCRGSTKSCLIRTKDAPIILTTQEIPRVLAALGQGSGTKTTFLSRTPQPLAC